MALEADVNYGFKGEVTSAVTPIVLGRGVLYSVEGPLDLQVTSGGGGDRAVSVRQGSAWGDGVLSTWNTGAVLNGASVSSGSRWDTVVIRREWTPESSPTGTATLMLLQGGSSRAISTSRTTDAGVTTSDQPIALVRFQAGQTAVQEIVDLRTWAGAGGGMVAVSDAALAYLDAPGTQVQIGFTQYTRTMIGGTPQWTTADTSQLAQVTNTPWGSSSINSSGLSGTRRYRIRNGWAVFQFQGQTTTNRTNADVNVLNFGNSAYHPQETAFGVVWVGGQAQRAYVGTGGDVHFQPATWTSGTTIQAYITWPVA